MGRDGHGGATGRSALPTGLRGSRATCCPSVASCHDRCRNQYSPFRLPAVGDDLGISAKHHAGRCDLTALPASLLLSHLGSA